MVRGAKQEGGMGAVQRAMICNMGARHVGGGGGQWQWEGRDLQGWVQRGGGGGLWQ